MPAAAGAPLIGHDDIRRLQRLSLDSLLAIEAGLLGRREGAGRAAGVEFADHRPYTTGDDVRSIDWHAYARLRELLVRTAPQDTRLALALLVDTSRSMHDGEPDKLLYAQRVAALLGAIALLRGDAATVQGLSDGEAVMAARLDAADSLGTLEYELRRLSAGGTTRLRDSLRRARATGGRPQVAVLLSDCLEARDDLGPALRELASVGDSAVLVHVFDPPERAAGDGLGSLELRDVETGEHELVVVTEEVRARYAAAVRQFSEWIEDRCRQAGVGYLAAPTSIEPLDLIFDAARSGTALRLEYER